MQQSNTFGAIRKTYAMILELEYNMPSWLHGKLGRRMPMKSLSLIHHSMVTWTMDALKKGRDDFMVVAMSEVMCIILNSIVTAKTLHLIIISSYMHNNRITIDSL